MHISKRGNLCLQCGLLATVAVVLLACAKSDASRTRVDFWAIGSEVEKIGELFDEFRRDNPDIEVRIQQIPWSAAHEKLLTAFAGVTNRAIRHGLIELIDRIAKAERKQGETT